MDELKAEIAHGTFGKVRIESIEIHPIFQEFFFIDALGWLAKHPFSESVTHSAVRVTKFPVIRKKGKSKEPKYLLTGNIGLYLNVLSLAISNPTYSTVTVVVDDTIDEAAIVDNTIHEYCRMKKDPAASALLAAVYVSAEKKKWQKDWQESLSLYRSDPGFLTKAGHLKQILGFDPRAFNKLKSHNGMSPSMTDFIRQELQIEGAANDVIGCKMPEEKAINEN